MLSAIFIIFLFSLDLAANASAAHGAKAWGPGELATALVNTFHDNSSGCKGISIFKDAPAAAEKQQEFYFVDMNTIEKLGEETSEKGIRKVPHKDWEDFVHATKPVPVPTQTVPVPPPAHYKRIDVAKMQQYVMHYRGGCKLKLPLSAGLEKMLESKMVKRPYHAPATVFGWF